MLFNSLAFAIFLPVVFAIYWMFPIKKRWIVLLVASYYFYMSWNPHYVLLILFVTVISYTGARFMEYTSRKSMKKLVLVASCALCLSVLFLFKYLNFISFSIHRLGELLSFHTNLIAWNLLLPVGISFYTFQTLSYLIDIYRGTVKSEPHFGYYAVFVSFFPQLVAGPIERTENLLPQLKSEHLFDYQTATNGIKRMAWGFYKKMIIADSVSIYVDRIYSDPHNYQGFAFLIATILFTFQIYCDFSGYSDIAIGTAALFGIKLTPNFQSPYLSHSIKEFWNRWHISLSTWFRDYVYIPLGGSRKGTIRTYFNLILTFLASGLWHGADWSFVLWGGIHGTGQVLERLFFQKHPQRNLSISLRAFKTILVFLFCSFAWIFFVSSSVSDATFVIQNMFHGITGGLDYLHQGFVDIQLDKRSFLKLSIFIFILLAGDYISLKEDLIAWINRQKTIIRYLAYFGLMFIIILFRSAATVEFVYFQF